MLIYKIKNKKTGEYLKENTREKFDYSTIHLHEALNEHRKMKFEGKDNYDDYQVVEEASDYSLSF